MRFVFAALSGLLLMSGCSATWEGVKHDSSEAWGWTKSKVNQSADYVREKTE